MGLLRLVILGGLSIAGLLVPTYVSLFAYSSLGDPVAKATVLSAVVTLFGVIFVAIFSEISSYYKDKAADAQRVRDDKANAEQRKWEDKTRAMQRKWEFIFPLLTTYYYPWIESAKLLASYLKEIRASTPILPNQASRALFYITLFFSTRLRLSLKAGGVPILADDADGDAVHQAYNAVKPTLDWNGKQTKTDVSFLQEYFLERDSPDKPYLASHFMSDIDSGTSDPKLANIRNTLQDWLSKNDTEPATKQLDNFIGTFEERIKKLNDAWLR